MRNIFLVVLTLLFLLCVVGCNSEIGNGEFLKFKIGMSQDEVLSALKKNKDITHIQPVLEESISVQEGTPSKEKKIERMLDSDGVILENGKSNLIIEIIFYRSSVTNVSSIGLHKENKLGIKVGMSKNEVKNIISESFSDGSINLAYNYLPDGAWRELDKVSTSEFGNYNHWGFHGASKYSYTKFNFVDGVLKTIDNKWSPIELP